MIERLYVHNFRCLENFTLDLVGHPSAVLIGKNGAGKSTVLRCLEIFQRICRGSSRVRNLISAGDFTRFRTDQPITSLRKMTNQCGQFIATTHHPETVRKFSDETTFVLTRKSHLDPSVVRPLSAFTYSGDLINALIRDEIIG